VLDFKRVETFAGVAADVLRFVVALAVILTCSTTAQMCLVAAGMSAWILFEAEGHERAGIVAWLGCVVVSGVIG
jgi:hypothetical protein